MSITTYPPHELQPRKLSPEETSNPYLVIQELFSFGHLPQLRELLWHWFKTTITGNYSKDISRGERRDIFNIYEHMEKLLEASHVIHSSRGGWARSAKAGEVTPLQYSKSPENNIINLLTLAIQPEAIYSFITQGEQRVTHLLIVIPNRSQNTFKHFEATLEMACINNQQYTWSLHQAAELHRQLSEGHFFYSAVCTYGNRLYYNDAPPLPLLSPEKINEIKTNAQQQLSLSCNRAAAFSLGANTYMKNKQVSMAAFMMQQAAEQLLRSAVLILMGQEIKTHSITVLLKYTRYCAPQLNEIFSAPDHRDLLPLLDKAYIDARYSSNFSITAQQANTMELLIATLLSVTEECVGAIIQSFGTQSQEDE